jgi:hypothetical protein
MNSFVSCAASVWADADRWYDSLGGSAVGSDGKATDTPNATATGSDKASNAEEEAPQDL